MMNSCLETPHPLLIREVVSTLFEYMARNELLEARLVCSQWKSIGWVELKKRIVFNFRTSSTLESYTEFFSSRSNYLSPITSYQFTLQFDPNYLAPLMDFFSNLGSKIQKLDLQRSNFILKQEFQEFITGLKYLTVHASRIELLPSIVEFRLNALYSLEIFCEEAVGTLGTVNEILRRQNCLKIFKINAPSSSAQFSEGLADMIATSESLRSLHIEELDLRFPINSLKLVDFGKNRFQLKSMSILIDNRNPDISITNDFYKFLKSQKNCLEKFQCRFSRWWQLEPEFGKIPYLNHLKEICLDMTAGDLQFLSDCRMLKNIKILSWRPDLNKVENEDFSTMPFVESAVITLSGFPVVYNVLDYMTLLLPGLRTFRFNANITGNTGIYSDLIRERLPQLMEKSVERLLPFGNVAVVK